MPTVDDAAAIWSAIHDANQAWMRGEPEATAALFADDVVGVAPDLEHTVRGKAAMVKSFVDYVAYARTHRFVEQARSIEVLGDVAVATYRFDVGYTLDGTVNDELGQEILVLRRLDGAWKVVWRSQIPVKP
jgi:uncharacterized protein (TIGR02246 family)